MGTALTFDKEKLIIGVLLHDLGLETPCLKSLERLFGPRDYTGPRLPFTFTSYYDEELGAPITRLFTAFERLVAPDALAGIKTAANGVEREFAAGGKRRLNLDPGILCLSRFILASTKPSSHRVPLADGIYAEIELMYERGAFRPVEWTYADYRSPAYLAVFKDIRGIYKKNLKATGCFPA